MRDAGSYWQPAAFGAGCRTLMPELVTELKNARRMFELAQTELLALNQAYAALRGYSLGAK